MRRAAGALILAVFGIHGAALWAQTVSGSGAKNCSDFMQAVELNSEVAINGHVSWAQGFISGFNWSNVNRKDVVIDAAGLKYWLVNYCSTRPEVGYYQAVQQLVSEQAR